jgi:hypothetical protein
MRVKILPMIFRKNWISASSLFLLVACGGSGPEDYAKRWCELNQKIEVAGEKDKASLIEEAKLLENEIEREFGKDPEAMRTILDLTDACD